MCSGCGGRRENQTVFCIVSRFTGFHDDFVKSCAVIAICLAGTRRAIHALYIRPTHCRKHIHTHTNCGRHFYFIPIIYSMAASAYARQTLSLHGLGITLRKCAVQSYTRQRPATFHIELNSYISTAYLSLWHDEYIFMWMYLLCYVHSVWRFDSIGRHWPHFHVYWLRQHGQTERKLSIELHYMPDLLSVSAVYRDNFLTTWRHFYMPQLATHKCRAGCRSTAAFVSYTKSR